MLRRKVGHASRATAILSPRALAQIEVLIAEAEKSLARHPAGTGKTKTRDRMQREQRRLALLHRSRQFLLSDEFSAVKGGRRH